MAKLLVFRYFFWFVLSVVFVTGATRISAFGLGYLLACFFFLLFGTQLLVKPSRTRLALWDCLIIYNVAVIISKNMLSVSTLLLLFQTQVKTIQMLKETAYSKEKISFSDVCLIRIIHSYHYRHSLIKVCKSGNILQITHHRGERKILQVAVRFYSLN